MVVTKKESGDVGNNEFCQIDYLCERTREINNDSKSFGLSNWKDGVIINTIAA